MADGSLAGAGAVVCAVGVVTAWIAVKTQREHRRWCVGKARAIGVVSRISARRTGGLSEDAGGGSADPAQIATPVVRFRAANGVEYEIDAVEAPQEVGAVVEVAYDPALPSGGRAVGRTIKILLPVVLIVLGAALLAVAVSRN